MFTLMETARLGRRKESKRNKRVFSTSESIWSSKIKRPKKNLDFFSVIRQLLELEKGALPQMSTRRQTCYFCRWSSKYKPQRKGKDPRLLWKGWWGLRPAVGTSLLRLGCLESGKKKNIECKRKSGETERGDRDIKEDLISML